MQLSARNQIKATIVEIEEGIVNAILHLKTTQGMELSASITNTSVTNMKLKAADEVICFFKASNVLIATSQIPEISARNKLSGTIKELKKGAVNSEVILSIGTDEVVSVITNDAVNALKLSEGQNAIAIIKASEVMIAK